MADELIIFSKEYSNNQQIEEKAALGLLWAQTILHHKKQRIKESQYRKEISVKYSNHLESDYLQKIKSISETYSKS